MFLVLATVLLCSVLLAGAAAAQEGAGAIRYVVQAGASSGGGYRLSGGAWVISGAASGGQYALAVPAAAPLAGQGCCCNYLPCLLRSVP